MTPLAVSQLGAAELIGRPWPSVGIARAFVASDSRAGVVAGIDPRQRASGRQVGTIGFVRDYRDDAALLAVIGSAEAWLIESGADVLRCPVNGTTWHGHRAVVDMYWQEGGEPSFPLEPANDRLLPEVLADAGWLPVHWALSYRVPIAPWLAGAGYAEARLAASGFAHRPLDTARFGEEIAAVHGIATEAFARNWGFSPISVDELAAIYAPLIGAAEPSSVRMLEDRSGRAVGFFFGYAEPAPSGGGSDTRFVAKTLAVTPAVAREHPGVGIGLAMAVHRWALTNGHRDALFAMAGEQSFSRRLGERWGSPIRRYATFEKVVARP